METRNWNNDLSDGKKAEELIRSWFGGQLGFNDLKVVCEVKNNWYGMNICIEEDSVVEQNKKGWIYTSQADNVIFVDLKNEQAVLIEMHDLQDTYNEIKEEYELKEQQTSKENTTWTSRHRWLPVNKFTHIFLRRFIVTNRHARH